MTGADGAAGGVGKVAQESDASRVGERLEHVGQGDGLVTVQQSAVVIGAAVRALVRAGQRRHAPMLAHIDIRRYGRLNAPYR